MVLFQRVTGTSLQTFENNLFRQKLLVTEMYIFFLHCTETH